MVTFPVNVASFLTSKLPVPSDSSKKFLQVTLLNLEEPPDLDTTDAPD